MLGTFFRIVDEFVFGGNVGLRCGAARTGARQWPDSDFVALGRGFLAHQNFRRRTDHLKVAHVVEIHVRAGVERTQRAVQRQRALRECFVYALPDLHLHEVTGFNQGFGALDRFQIIGLVKLALRLVFFRGFEFRHFNR